MRRIALSYRKRHYYRSRITSGTNDAREARRGCGHFESDGRLSRLIAAAGDIHCRHGRTTRGEVLAAFFLPRFELHHYTSGHFGEVW